MSPIIISNAFIDKLLELGIADTKTRRVVIDATVGEPVRLYLDKFADERIVELARTGIIVEGEV